MELAVDITAHDNRSSDRNDVWLLTEDLFGLWIKEDILFNKAA